MVNVLFASPPSFFTSFDGSENPLSDGGKWITGSVGIDWTDLQKVSGSTTYTLTPGLGSGGAGLNDSIAQINSSFQSYPPNQSVQCTLDSASFTHYHEAEIHLRRAISPHVARGYEVLVNTDTTCSLVCWNGAFGSFTVLVNMATGNVSIANGAVWFASIVGTVITVKCNGVTVTGFPYDTAGDAVKWSDGQPGVGSDTLTDQGTPTGLFGWTDFQANSL